MILDNTLEFADAVSVAAAAGTALIGDVVDLGAQPDDIAVGTPMYLVITVDTEVITGGAAGTLTFKLASDAQAAIATDGTATVHVASPAFVTDGTDANAAELKAGATTFVVALPSGVTYERYLGILAVTATTTTTAGAINAFLTTDVARWKAYADASN
jgi:hypothetical protein